VGHTDVFVDRPPRCFFSPQTPLGANLDPGTVARPYLRALPNAKSRSVTYQAPNELSPGEARRSTSGLVFAAQRRHDGPGCSPICCVTRRAVNRTITAGAQLEPDAGSTVTLGDQVCGVEPRRDSTIDCFFDRRIGTRRGPEPGGLCPRVRALRSGRQTWLVRDRVVAAAWARNGGSPDAL